MSIKVNADVVIDNSKNLCANDGTFSGTGAVKVPSGTTAQRPTATNGMLRYNSSTARMETYVDGGWQNVTTDNKVVDAIPPSTLGQSTQGGFYVGTICAAGTTYYLIVAPNSTGCAVCQWKTTNTSTAGTTSTTNGYANTYGPMNNATHPAGNFTATRTINGFSDWYLPAIDELQVLYNNKGSMPSGEGFANANYWSSTEFSAYSACFLFFFFGPRDYRPKTYSFSLRAVRRVPI